MPRADPRILIVDDDPTITLILIEALSFSIPGASVSRALNADHALLILAYKPCDFLITDNRMPGKDGIDLIQEVIEKYPNTHVVMMTAYRDVPLQRRLSELGEIQLLRKPFGIDELLEALHEH